MGVHVRSAFLTEKRSVRDSKWTTEAAANVAGALPCHRRSRKGPSSQVDGRAPARKRSGGGSSPCCVAGPVGRELGAEKEIKVYVYWNPPVALGDSSL